MRLKKLSKNVFVSFCQYFSMSEPPTKIWLKVNGGIVQEGQIEITRYAIFLQNLQKLVNCLRDVKYPDVDEAYFKLYAGKVYKSSHLTSIGTINQTNLNNDPLCNEINEDISKLIRCLIEGDKEFISALSESIEDPGEKIKVLKTIKNLLSKKEYNISVGFLPERPKSFIRIPSGKEQFVDDLIKEYTSQAVFETQGVITRHKGDEPRNFVITTTKGEKIVCHYSEEMESYVHDHWKDPIFIKGIMSKSIRKNVMDEIIDIQPFKTLSKTAIGEFNLIRPIAIDVSYNKSVNVWKLSNDSISVYGKGKKFEKAEKSFSEAFERLVIGTLSFKEEKLSKKSKEIKKILESYLNFEDYKDMLDSVCFEE
jgi:hypothetical protein